MDFVYTHTHFINVKVTARTVLIITKAIREQNQQRAQVFVPDYLMCHEALLFLNMDVKYEELKKVQN